MPKRVVSDAVDHSDSWFTSLPLWRATGLSLAVIGSAAFNGVAALCAAVIAAVVIFALARLRRHAPHSPSTGDLVGSTLGPVAGRFTSLIQLVAYVVIGANAAAVVGLQPLVGVPDFATTVNGWWWPAWSVAVAAIAGALVALLPTRTVGAVAAVLAAAGLLVYFYLALGVVARVASGTEPVAFGQQLFPSTLLLVAGLIPLGLGLAGFETATVANSRLRSVGRPLGVAVGATALCAAMLLLAVNVGATGGFRYSATDLFLVVGEFFGNAGGYWMLTGTVALASAVLLALMWAATWIAGRLFGAGVWTSVLVTSVVAALALAMCRNWGDIGGLLLPTPALLLVVVYVLVGEANSRIPGDAAATQVPRALLAVVLVAAVLIPLRATDFAADSLWPLVVTTVILAVAALLSGAGRPAPQSPQLR